MEPGQAVEQQPKLQPERSLIVTPWVTQASIFIPLVTLVAYLWALSYEIGYYSCFNIPAYFISIRPHIIFSAPVVHVYAISFMLLLFSLICFVMYVTGLGKFLIPTDFVVHSL